MVLFILISLKKYSFLIYFILFLVIFQGNLFSQSAFRRGIKFGLELKDYLAGRSGSFANVPEFEFGVFTGIDLYSPDNNSLSLKVELNFVKLMGYKLRQVYLIWSGQNSNFYKITEDERIVFPFIELGIIPEYFFILNNNTMVSLFLGPSIGFGLQGNEFSPPYDNSDGPQFHVTLPLSLNSGVNFYYKKLLAGIKYRYCYIRGADINEFNKISLQVGLVFQ